jgi:FkbM family methyltransferase
VDVGANLGIHALVLSRCVGAEGRVFAYEPIAPIYQRLTANLALNGAGNVVTKPYGLGERTEVLRFDEHAGEFNIGKGRIDSRGSGAIQIRALDDELRGIEAPISLIKIDVEGFELAVLKGARELLQRHRPAILLEYNPGAYHLADVSACLPYAVRYEKVPVTCWESLVPIDPDAAPDRADLLITPARHATA